MCKEYKKKKKRSSLIFIKLYDTRPYLLALHLQQQSNLSTGVSIKSTVCNYNYSEVF